MEHQRRIAVLEIGAFPELQENCPADPKSGPCFKPGGAFLLERNGQRGGFRHMPEGRFRAGARDCGSRCVRAALPGGSVMKGRTDGEKMMIACGGSRPVMFKIGRIDVDGGAQ